MESITRDTYPKSATFTAVEIRDIAIAIASALEHLHSRQLAHGDLYAHNILWRRATPEGAHGLPRAHHHSRARRYADVPHDEHAEAKLSDFGAAFYYGGSGGGGGGGGGGGAVLHFERMEVRAFGLLLEELLERHDGSDHHTLGPVRAAARLGTLEASQRPSFQTLREELQLEAAGNAMPRRGLRPRSTFGRVLPQ